MTFRVIFLPLRVPSPVRTRVLAQPRFAMKRFIAVAGLLLISGVVSAADRPNFVVIFCDDLGYGDLSCYGHPTIQTPHLDTMAAEGTRATQFYVAASVCTPSRAALLTGRYPVRTGLWGKRRVLFPDSVGGMPDRELTMAELLRDAGYSTAMVGKWHLGHLPEYLPTSHGFDQYYGIPYSNDMDKVGSNDPEKKGRKVFNDPDWKDFNVPLMSGTAADGCEIIERPVVQTTITERYTEKSIEYLNGVDADEPFFLYLAHSLPHVPLFRSEAFEGHSRAGLYGDVIEEIDAGVGRILQTLRDRNLDQNTLVVFTSDNGPWLTFRDQGGSAGCLRDGKGTTFDGGMRVPGIFWMPGTIPAGRIAPGLSSTLDLLPTFAAMAGAEVPGDRVLDGFDQSAWLTGNEPSARKSMFFYRDHRLMAIRHGDHKAHFITQTSYVPKRRAPQVHQPPLLYDLAIDLREQNDVAAQSPEILEAIAKVREQHEAAMEPAASQLDRK